MSIMNPPSDIVKLQAVISFQNSIISFFSRAESPLADFARMLDVQNQVLRDVVANLEKNKVAEATELENLTAQFKTWMETLSKKLAKKYGKRLAMEIIHEMNKAPALDAYGTYDDDGLDGDDGANDGQYEGDEVCTWGGQEEDVEGGSWDSTDTFEGSGVLDDGEGGSLLVDLIDVLFSMF
ncbi:hypothetical protein CcaverHIS631_0302330 [Cutaneotrichosporon cavernicola]|nr:hypothetical protein CcaverHIS631_0302330 [Cutaneotrichosporon cavernicola]